MALSEKRPNILWLSCEDTGPELRCYGDPHAITPTLDRLASEGVRYTRAYTVAGVCAPSRSGIITGMMPSSLGSQHMRCAARLPEHVKPFPVYLRKAGYYCTNNAKTDYNLDQIPAGSWDESSRQAHWRKRAPGQPFFAVFNFEVTHESRLPLRGGAFLKQTNLLRPEERQDPAKLRTIPPYHPDTPECRRDWANYYETITQMDREAAARLKEVEDAGLLEDTIVMFWGDHGVGLPRSKRWLYESGTHVPLIVRIPEKFRVDGQGEPGSVDPQLVSFIDLAPTLLNLGGAPIPAHMQGRAFLGPKTGAPRTYIYGARDRMDERYDIIRSVSDKRFRYIRNYEPWKPYYQEMRTPEAGPTMKELRRLHAEGALPPAAEQFMKTAKPPEELYDVDADPHEVQNLADSPGHRRELERLRREHRRWQRVSGDLGLLPEPLLSDEEERLGSRWAISQQPGWRVRQEWLFEVATAPERGEVSRPALEKALADKDPAVRWWAIRGLERLGPEKVPKATLEKMLRDETAVVRVAAAHALAGSGASEEAIRLLILELKNVNEWIRLEAAHALEDLGKEARPARKALEEAAREERGDGSRFNYVARVAERALARMGEQ